jgi:NADH:ubiquinone oxidoreductase subunit H
MVFCKVNIGRGNYGLLWGQMIIGLDISLHLFVCWLNKPEYAQLGQSRVTKSIAQHDILSYIVIVCLLCDYWKCYTVGFCQLRTMCSMDGLVFILSDTH